jgi:hypothetical protein
VSVSDLPAGPNVITLTATNSAGVAASTSITVFVDDDLQLPGPTPAVGPTQVGWSVNPGATTPLSATVQISNSGGGSLSWTASADAPWLTLSATEGGAPARLTLSADPSGMRAGTTTRATLTLSFSDASGAALGNVELPVGISVGDAFSGNQGDSGGGPAGRTLYLPLLRR